MTPTPHELTAMIKARAHALGFDKVGIIPATALDKASDAGLRAWLESGYQAEMQWMVTHLEKRLDPASLMEGTRSIICVGMNYYNPDAYAPHDPQALKIAKYARGTDYHSVVKDRLKALLAEIRNWAPGVQGRALTDSAPIMEKPLAVQAGLGWMGRHGNLITPDLGSWLFLGELLLDIDLVYEETPVPNLCGSCRRCMDACPTEAIVADTVVDANRCISYWTIEYKGETFPEAVRENLQGWIFGCDICQNVCPWNIKFARPTREAAFEPRPLNRAPQADILLSLDEEAFREAFRKSPLKRAKRTGLHRNIRQALMQPDAV